MKPEFVKFKEDVAAATDEAELQMAAAVFLRSLLPFSEIMWHKFSADTKPFSGDAYARVAQTLTPPVETTPAKTCAHPGCHNFPSPGGQFCGMHDPEIRLSKRG